MQQDLPAEPAVIVKKMARTPYISPEARALALKQGHCFISSSLRRPNGGCTFIRRNASGDIVFIAVDKPVHRPWSDEGT